MHLKFLEEMERVHSALPNEKSIWEIWGDPQNLISYFGDLPQFTIRFWRPSTNLPYQT